MQNTIKDRTVLNKNKGTISGFVLPNSPKESGFILSQEYSNTTFSEKNESQHSFTDVHTLPWQSGLCIIQKAKLHGKWIIIKRLKKEYLQNEKIKNLFYSEFLNSYDLDHPNVVRVIDFAIDAQGPYYIMEYIDGRRLSDFIQTSGINDGYLVKKIAMQILDALSYIHKKQIFHRDLKPDNILLTNKGDNVKIIDFGLSATDSFEDGIIALDSGRYTAPELQNLTFNAKFDARTDIYSFGLILQELLIGQTYDSQLEKLRFPLFDVVEKCTQTEKDSRFRDCEEIIKTIQKVNVATYEEPSVPFYETLLSKDYVLQNEKYYWAMAMGVISFIFAFSFKLLFAYLLAASVFLFVAPLLVLTYFAIIQQDL